MKRRAARRIAVKKALMSLEEKVTTAIVEHLAKEHQTEVSASTVARDLKAIGGKALVMPKGPWRMEGDEQKRVQFARRILRAGPKTFNKWVFSDEKIFEMRRRGGRWEWVIDRDNRRCRENVPQGEKLHVWGAVGPNGYKKLIFLPTQDAVARIPRHFKYVQRPPTPKKDPRTGKVRGRKRKPLAELKRYQKARRGIDHELYIDLVFAKVVTKRAHWQSDWVLMQDGAKIHHTKEVMQWLKRKQIKTVDWWPKRSPDLNPQENVWSVLQHRANIHKAGTIAELRTAIQREFDDLDTTAIFQSFERRLAWVLQVKGRTLTGEHRLNASKRRYCKLTGAKLRKLP